MTIWTPSLEGRPGPKYMAIAEAIADDIAAGELETGQRLPTHRDLAYRLGVTVGTVSRAYAEISRRGLTVGEVGRGTFVSSNGKTGAMGGALDTLVSPSVFHRAPRADIIDMSMNRPTTGQAGEHLAGVMGRLAQSDGLGILTEYQPPFGMPSHREAGAKLLRGIGMQADPGAVILTNGGQHAMAALLLALVDPGDVVLTEALTYPAVKALAQAMSFRLKSVAMDGDGMIPEALEAACRKSRPRAIYIMPTLHNPLNAIMPLERRRAIAEICERHGVAIIEDDVYGFLPAERPAPVCTYAPEQGYFITSTSKSIAPGLRVGYVVAPPGKSETIGRAVQMTGWMIPPLMGEIASRWIEDGTAAELIAWHRENARFRMALAKKVLDGFDMVSHPESYHIWLKLPASLAAERLIGICMQRGIAVSPPQSFTLDGDPVPNAVRLCLGSADTMKLLEKGLRVLRDIIDAPSQPDLALF